MDKDNELLDLHIDVLRKSKSDIIKVLKEIIQGIEHGKDFDNRENLQWQISKVSDESLSQKNDQKQ